MMRFITRVALFSIPFWVYFAFIAIVDPFGFINIAPISAEQKYPVASALNQCFWKMNAFRQSPSSRILLGDSRMLAIHSEKLREMTRADYFNRRTRMSRNSILLFGWH